jgi:hypothetical protein
LPSALSSWLGTRDFFRFGYLMKKLQGMNFRLRNGVIFALTAILSEIYVRTVSGAFDQWSARLYGCKTNSMEHV